MGWNPGSTAFNGRCFHWCSDTAVAGMCEYCRQLTVLSHTEVNYPVCWHIKPPNSCAVNEQTFTVCKGTPKGLGGFKHLRELQHLKNFLTTRCPHGPSAPQGTGAHCPHHPERKNVPTGFGGPLLCSEHCLVRTASLNPSKPVVWERQSWSRNQAGHQQSWLHSDCLIKTIFGIETHGWEGKQKADKLAIKKRCGRIAEPYQPFQTVSNRGHDKSVFVLLLSRCAWSGDKTLARVHFAGETRSYSLTRLAK